MLSLALTRLRVAGFRSARVTAVRTLAGTRSLIVTLRPAGMRLVTVFSLKLVAAWAVRDGTLSDPRTRTVQGSRRQRMDTAIVRPAGWTRRTRTLARGGVVSTAVARSKTASWPAIADPADT